MAPDANHSLDSRRQVRDQEARLATSLNVFRPYIQFNAAMLHVWSGMLSMVAHNVEKSIEAFGGIVNEQQQDTAQHY